MIFDPDSASSPATASTEDLLARIARLGEGDPRRVRLRAEIIDRHLPNVAQITNRYAHRGEPADDIRQAALLGLVKALNGYDPECGGWFVAYATPMMLGEVKRHFRDRTWAIRVPRRTQELRIAMRQATRDFTDTHHRAPTIAEVAALLEISEDETIAVIGADQAYHPDSLDMPTNDDTDSDTVGDLIGAEDPALDAVINHHALRPLLNDLPVRERTILLLRFYGNKTQAQIARQVGISEMHVSRLIAATLQRLRHALLHD